MTKSFYNQVYQSDHPSQYGGGYSGMPERSKLLWQQVDDWLGNIGLKDKANAKVLEIGCGMAFLSKIHPGWHGAEYSKTAVKRVKQRDGLETQISEEDAQNLSYPDATFDAVFSFAAIEHMPDPNKAFQEIDRILVRGGHALIAPAWNCRSWTVSKIEQRPWADLSILEKSERCSIPLREHIFYRALMAMPMRLWTELLMLFTERRLPLRFRVLYPRWDLIEKYGHVSDDDAVANIESHAGIVFFKTRNYQILSHPSLLSRLMARGEAVVVQKNTL
jgi:SAM-dependent methyltransferase